jgi:hypothetical protein
MASTTSNGRIVEVADVTVHADSSGSLFTPRSERARRIYSPEQLWIAQGGIIEEIKAARAAGLLVEVTFRRGPTRYALRGLGLGRES